MAQVVAFVSIEMSKKREEGRFSRLVLAHCSMCYDASKRTYVCVCARKVRVLLHAFSVAIPRARRLGEEAYIGTSCQRLSVRREVKFLRGEFFARANAVNSLPVDADKTARGEFECKRNFAQLSSSSRLHLVTSFINSSLFLREIYRPCTR